jgi:hypothetical protein
MPVKKRKLWNLPGGDCTERLEQTGEHVAPVSVTIPPQGVMGVPVRKLWCAFCGQDIKKKKRKGK